MVKTKCLVILLILVILNIKTVNAQCPCDSASLQEPLQNLVYNTQNNYYKQQKEYQEYNRVNNLYLSKHREIFNTFDEDKNGKLLGAEKSKYDRYMYRIRTGKETNPFKDIK